MLNCWLQTADTAAVVFAVTFVAFCLLSILYFGEKSINIVSKRFILADIRAHIKIRRLWRLLLKTVVVGYVLLFLFIHMAVLPRLDFCLIFA